MRFVSGDNVSIGSTEALMKQPGLDGRHRNENGEIRRKRSDTRLGTLRDEYGSSVAKGYRSDTHLGTVLKKEGLNSLNDLLKRDR